MECRKCGQRFIEMSKLAFHRCQAKERATPAGESQ
jgi:hypothetical protein